MSGIQNFIGEFLLWDVFIQGIVAILVLIMGISLWVFTLSSEFNNYLAFDKTQLDGNHISNEATNKNEEEDSFTLEIEEDKDAQELHSIFSFLKLKVPGLVDLLKINTQESTGKVIFSIVIIMSIIYTVGIFMSKISDSFMDGSNASHIYLKRLWFNPTMSDLDELSLTDTSFVETLDETDNFMKIKAFNKVFHFSKEHLIEDNKDSICQKVAKDNTGTLRREIYYYAKNKILGNSVWKSDIVQTQNLINISQVITLSSYLLLMMCISNFFLYTLRQTKYRLAIQKNLKSNKIYKKDYVNFPNDVRIKSIKIIKIRLYLFFTILAISLCELFWLYKDEYAAKYLIITFIGLYFLCWFVFWLFGKDNDYFGTRTKTTILMSIFSLIIYFTAAHSWIKNENEINTKIYSIFKQMEGESPMILEHDGTSFLISSFKKNR